MRLGTLGVALAASLAACGGGSGQAEQPTAQTPAAPAAPAAPAQPTVTGGASPSESGAVPESVGEGYRPVWADEFEGTKLGPDWMFRNVLAPNRKCSPPDAGQTSLKGGILSLTVSRDETKKPNKTTACPDGQYLNAQIGTQRAQSWLHGIFAARVLFHAPQGAHGSFWMQPARKAPGAQPGDPLANGTEIDVIEYFGDGYSKGGLASFVYYPTKGEDGAVTAVKSGGLLPDALPIFNGERPSEGYHVYSVEWTPAHYVFRIDGKVTYRLRKGVSGVPQYAILSLLSSNYELPEITPDALPMSMKVDWVRVWQK